MLIWKGWGLLALLIPLFCSVLVGEVVDANYGEDFYKNSEWAMPLVLSLSSLPLLFIGYKLNKKPGRVVMDVETQERFELKTIHSMFWIPLQYWPLIIVGISVWMYVSNIGLIYQD